MKVNGLNADVEQRDGSIASLQKEKKHLEGVNAQTLEDLQAMEDKANNLAKNKVKLEQTIEEVGSIFVFIHKRNIFCNPSLQIN